MNIQQFRYILALATYRHYETAAGKCYISQSTLSTMISKFEEEIGLQIFDRKKKPVAITNEGQIIINHLKIVMNEINELEELVQEVKGEIKGHLKISVIPTIAPFLLPLFLQKFAHKYSELNIEVREQTTEEIIRLIKAREIDIGIVSTPLEERDILEINLYKEPFVYFGFHERKRKTISQQELNLSNLCLLEEGHCLRTQIINLCEMQKESLQSTFSFDYRAGSIDSLLRFVKANKAATLIPYLATLDMTTSEKNQILAFDDPVPYRSVSLVTHRHFVKKKVLNKLHKAIMDSIRTKIPEVNHDSILFTPT